MESLPNVLLLVLMFFLRLAVPLLITIAIAYGLKRLDAKWQAEADRQAAATKAVAKALQPAMAAPGLGAIPGGAVLPLPPMVAAGATPCWSVKGCSEAARAKCAAYHQPDQPCWAARQAAEGKLPAKCRDCNLYQPLLH